MRKNTQIFLAIFFAILLSIFPFFRNVLPSIFSLLFFFALISWSLWVVYVTYLFISTWRLSSDRNNLISVRNLYTISFIPIFAWATALGVQSAFSVAFNQVSFPGVVAGFFTILILAFIGFLLAFIPPILLHLYIKVRNEKIKRILFWIGTLYAGIMILPYIFFAFAGLLILS